MDLGRRIAFDFGTVRIGVALSDPSGVLASPYRTLLAEDPYLIDQIRQLFIELEPIYIVVGDPIHLSGEQSPKSDAARTFARSLRELTQVPIYLIDERLSTVGAFRSLQATGHTAKSARSKIDEIAAVNILESALAQEKSQGKIAGALQ